MSGYGLARLFERTLARTWPARHPQIYPALAELESHGLLRVASTGPRRRKTYAVTGAGVAEVQRWLRDTRPDRTVRNETILRLFMLWLLDSPRRSSSSTTRSRATNNDSQASSRRSQTTNANAASTGPRKAEQRSAPHSHSSGASATNANTLTGRHKRATASPEAPKAGIPPALVDSTSTRPSHNQHFQCGQVFDARRPCGCIHARASYRAVTRRALRSATARSAAHSVDLTRPRHGRNAPMGPRSGRPGRADR